MGKSYFKQELGREKKADRIKRDKADRIPRGRGQLKMAHNSGRIGQIANLCKSNKRRQMDEIREKKKNVCSDGNASFLDDILVYEILPRLPSKSLMRFKSTCKRWLSLIQHDPHFHDSHFNHARVRSCQLVLLLPKWKKSPLMNLYCGLQECLFSADLDQGRASVDITSVTSSLEDYNGILNPVNGLICFFNKNGSICLCNLGTREITPWICSTLVLNNKNEFESPRYGFGFDPTTKEHKVIRVWRTKPPMPLVACEILTVGHNKWRRVDEVPFFPYKFDQEGSIYVNGSVYWIYHRKSRFEQESDNPLVIIAFDVGSEKFRTIPVPDSVFDQCYDGVHTAGLLEVDGRVALFCGGLDGHTVKLWTYFDDHSYDNNNNISTSNTNWSEETIKLPFCLDRGVEKLSFHGVAGTDQLIIRCVFRAGAFCGWPVFLYSYNKKSQSFKEVEISGISTISDPTCSLFTPFLESLFPVGSNGTPTHTLDLKSKFIQYLRGPSPFFCH